ncbi:MAG: hypothetical protein ACI9UK_001821, partial [Candidatus Krumholzibacteriia bacterium]
RLRTPNNRKVIVSGGDYEMGQPLRAKVTGFKNTTFLGTVED